MPVHGDMVLTRPIDLCVRWIQRHGLRRIPELEWTKQYPGGELRPCLRPLDTIVQVDEGVRRLYEHRSPRAPMSKDIRQQDDGYRWSRAGLNMSVRRVFARVQPEHPRVRRRIPARQARRLQGAQGDYRRYRWRVSVPLPSSTTQKHLTGQ